jgi:hypothetical protein
MPVRRLCNQPCLGNGGDENGNGQRLGQVQRIAVHRGGSGQHQVAGDRSFAADASTVGSARLFGCISMIASYLSARAGRSLKWSMASFGTMRPKLMARMMIAAVRPSR